MLSATLLSGCGADGLCGSDIVKVARAPLGDRYAVVEVRDCGATTGYVSVVRIGRASRPQRDAREVFVADDDHGAAQSRHDGALAIDIAWVGAGQVRITYPARARIVTRRIAADGVTIVYRTFPR